MALVEPPSLDGVEAGGVTPAALCPSVVLASSALVLVVGSPLSGPVVVSGVFLAMAESFGVVVGCRF
jgi:hypothetical protein